MTWTHSVNSTLPVSSNLTDENSLTFYAISSPFVLSFKKEIIVLYFLRSVDAPLIKNQKVSCLLMQEKIYEEGYLLQGICSL
jgi:hypothetical protein